jgi:hypothetical protein
MAEKEINKPKSIEELINLKNEERVVLKANNNLAKYEGHARYIGKFEDSSMKGLHYFRVENHNSIMVLPITAKEEDINVNELGEVILKNANYHKNNRGRISSHFLEERDYFKYFITGLLKK